MGKCKAGDLVRVKRTIVENLGKGSWGAYADKDAVVDHTDCTGDQYCLCFKEMGCVSWFDDFDVEFVEHHREDLKEQWQKEIEERNEKTADLDWIFAQSRITDLTGSSFQALYELLGGHSLWGSRGEGLTYFHNVMCTAQLVEPFLKTHDKNGFLVFAEKFKTEYENSKKTGK